MLRPARAGLASSRSTNSRSARSSCCPEAASRQPQALDRSHAASRGRSGRRRRGRAAAPAAPARRSGRPPPRPAARASSPRVRDPEPPQGVDAEASCAPLLRFAPGRSREAIKRPEARRRQAAEPSALPLDDDRGGRRARILDAAAWAASRRRPGSQPGAGAERSPRPGEDRLGRAAEPRSGSVAKNASPGRPGSTAAPIDSRRRSDCSQRRLGAHRVGRRRGSDRALARAPRPSRMPARTPSASAGPDASPTTCGPPGSGARATGRPSSSRRSPSALISESRGMRAQATGHRESVNRTHVRIGPRICQARPAETVTIGR